MPVKTDVVAEPAAAKGLVPEPAAAKGLVPEDAPLGGGKGEPPAEVSLRGKKPKPPRPVSMPPAKLAAALEHQTPVENTPKVLLLMVGACLGGGGAIQMSIGESLVNLS